MYLNAEGISLDAKAMPLNAKCMHETLQLNFAAVDLQHSLATLPS